MNKRLEEFTALELLERRNIQELLHTALLELKKALDKREYNTAIFYNITGARLLNILVNNHLALDDEADMLDTLQSNVTNILKLQNRLQ